MKTLLGLITALLIISAIVSGVAALALLYGAGLAGAWKEAGGALGFFQGLFIAALGVSLIAGLICAIVSAAGGLLMALIHLLGRRWLAAAFALLACAAGAGLWLFFVSTDAYNGI